MDMKYSYKIFESYSELINFANKEVEYGHKRLVSVTNDGDKIVGIFVKEKQPNYKYDYMTIKEELPNYNTTITNPNITATCCN
ncbi:MAG: hypothetical protein NC548_26030 [Lachnospiraceae bacterium]|nr:hypothetical protein [Lachnospiraceae bacterium]